MMMRKLIGWCVAAAFAWKRRGVVRKMKAGWRLPVVFHALDAASFGEILAWFAARGVVDKLQITMDDGWLCVKDYVPYLKKYGVRASLFIAPGQTRRGHVWTEEANRLGLDWEVWHCWYKLDEAARNEQLDAQARQAGRGARLERTLLTEDEVKAIAQCGVVDIENHTWSHLSATDRPADEVLSEVVRAQAELTAWTGRAPRLLAWPFGRGSEDLDARVRALGLEPLYTKNLPEGRTMAIEGVSFQENIGRLTGAWPKVGTTR